MLPILLPPDLIYLFSTIIELNILSQLDTYYILSIIHDMNRKKIHNSPCPIEPVLQTFGGKWKPSILFYLEQKGTMRFNELKRTIPEITQRMLTQQLRELERDGLVNREHYPEIPPRVEYSSTKLALTLTPIFQAMEAWGAKNKSAIYRSRERYDAKGK